MTTSTHPALDRATYRKSTFSGAGNDCVELAVTPRVTGVRDTKARAAGALVLPDAARAALVAFARDGGGGGSEGDE